MTRRSGGANFYSESIDYLLEYAKGPKQKEVVKYLKTNERAVATQTFFRNTLYHKASARARTIDPAGAPVQTEPDAETEVVTSEPPVEKTGRKKQRPIRQRHRTRRANAAAKAAAKPSDNDGNGTNATMCVDAPHSSTGGGDPNGCNDQGPHELSSTPGNGGGGVVLTPRASRVPTPPPPPKREIPPPQTPSESPPAVTSERSTSPPQPPTSPTSPGSWRNLAHGYWQKECAEPDNKSHKKGE